MTSNNWLDFGAVIRIKMRVRELLKKFLPLRDEENCKNFSGSAAFVEAFGLRVLLVLECISRSHIQRKLRLFGHICRWNNDEYQVLGCWYDKWCK